MLTPLDRSPREITVEGTKLTVIPFNHLQEMNFARFNAAPFMGGVTRTVDESANMTAVSVAWATEADVTALVDMIASCVTSESLEWVISLPIHQVLAIGREVNNLSTLTEDQEQDLGGSSSSESSSEKPIPERSTVRVAEENDEFVTPGSEPPT